MGRGVSPCRREKFGTNDSLRIALAFVRLKLLCRQKTHVVKGHCYRVATRDLYLPLLPSSFFFFFSCYWSAARQ